MWRSRVLCVFPALVCVAGCVSVDTARSYVEAVPKVDAAKLGRVIADYMKDSYPAAQTTLVIIPPQDGQTDNPFTNSLVQSLSHAGFALADPGTTGGPQYHRFSYFVMPFDGGALVRLVVDEHQATRCYVQQARGIVPVTPLTLSN
jgi:hypothetical protein